MKDTVHLCGILLCCRKGGSTVSRTRESCFSGVDYFNVTFNRKRSQKKNLEMGATERGKKSPQKFSFNPISMDLTLNSTQFIEMTLLAINVLKTGSEL